MDMNNEEQRVAAGILCSLELSDRHSDAVHLQ